MSWSYLDRPEQWAAVAAAIRKQGVVGVDTETYGHNVKESTPAWRARVDVWSLALATPELHPRGYHVARACVLPLSAALDENLRSVLGDPAIVKVFHNAHHDQHAFANEGIELANVFDTLDMARLAWPGMGNYSIKPLRVVLLGKPEREGFKELTEPDTVIEQYTKDVVIKRCECGAVPCHKRTTAVGHKRLEVTVPEIKERTVRVDVPIESIVPGHPRFARKVDYAGDDAADGLELRELGLARLARLEAQLPELPW